MNVNTTIVPDTQFALILFKTETFLRNDFFAVLTAKKLLLGIFLPPSNHTDDLVVIFYFFFQENLLKISTTRASIWNSCTPCTVFSI